MGETMNKARTMKLRRLFMALALATPLAAGAGCAVEPQGDEPDEAVVDEAELSAAGRTIQGSYEENGLGDIRGLVLSTERASSSKNRFFAVVRTGIVCVMAPCPTEARVSGTWSATKTVLTLTPTSCPPGVHCGQQPFPEKAASDKLRGKYLYDFVKLGQFGAKLHLEPKPQAGGVISSIYIPGSLAKVSSYCTANTDGNVDNVSADCRVQGLPEPMCAQPAAGFIPLPKWTCSGQSRCEFSCSQLTRNPCAVTLCIAGTHCIAPNDVPACVPD